MLREKIHSKFGKHYLADEQTFKMGIDIRITKQIAKRFYGMSVLETCTGAGFTTIALAESAAHVISVEINENNYNQAKKNLEIAGCHDKVTLIKGDILNKEIYSKINKIDAAFLDPDWNDDGENHIYKFKNSNMKPPADKLLETIIEITGNIALILSPQIDSNELNDFPPHELQKIFLDSCHALNCLYFGRLVSVLGESKLII